MIGSAITAILAMTFLLGGWLAVQRLWTVAGNHRNEDALANRLGCHGCHCVKQCEKNHPSTTPRPFKGVPE